MLFQESLWLKRIIEGLDLPKQTKVLNFGSQRLSSLKYQDYISENVYDPISKKDWKLINFDLFPGEGVDISGDILRDDVFTTLREFHFKLILVCNVLEHVEDIQNLVKRIEDVIPSGGYLIVTVPYHYPKHYDPIDNNFRPTPDELSIMFPACVVVKNEIITDEPFYFYLKRNSRVLIKYIFRLLTPFYKPQRWISQVAYIPFFMRRFKVTVILFKKK